MNRLFNRNDNLAVILAGIFSIIIGLGISRFVFTSLIPSMLDNFLTITFAGILASLNFAGYLAGAMLSIFIKDINQKVKLFRVGLIIIFITTIIQGFTQNEIVWIICRVLAGFGGAMAFIVGAAIVMTKLKMESKTKAMGIHFSGIGFSILTTDLISRYIIANYNSWEYSWIVLALIGFILSIYSWYILCFDEEIQVINTTKHAFDFSVFTVFVIVLIIAYFTEGVGFVVQGTFLPDIINAIPGLEGMGNFTWTLVGLAGIPSCIIWMRLAHKYGSVNIIIIAMLLQCVGILIPTLTSNMYLNLLSGIFYGGTFVGLVALFMNLGGILSKGNPVVLMGALTTSYGIGQVIGPLYSVYLIEKFGSYNNALYLTALIVLSGVVLLLVTKRFAKES
jgi:MFS family permease